MTSALAPSLLVVVALAGCGPGPEAPPQCPSPSARTSDDVDPASWLVFATDEGARIKSVAGGAPAGARVRLGDEEAVADAQGAFDLRAPTETGPTTLEVDGVTFDVAPRNVDDALVCAVGAPRATGTLPNDVVLVSCDGRPHAAVTLSAEGAVDVLDASGERRAARPVFPVEGGVGAQPFGIARVGEGPRAVVTLFAWHAVALVDLCDGRVLDVARVEDAAGVPLRFPVDPPLLLPGPVDADRDGQVEEIVTRAAALHPQGVAASGDAVVVAFTGHLWPATDDADQLLAPGVLARFDVVDDALVLVEARAIEGARNPQAVISLDDGYLVSLSGPFARGGATAVADDGALLFVDDAGTPLWSMGTGRFAPARPAVASGRVVVGSLVSPEIAIVDADAESLAEATLLSVPGRAVSSLFDAAAIGGGLVVVTDFTEDRLHFVDVARDVALAWPFEAGLPLASRSEIFRGALAVDVTGDAPGRTTAAVLLGLSSEVVFVDLAGIFGP